MVDDTVASGNSVVEVAYLYEEWSDMAKKHGTSWYRSKDRKGGVNPFSSYLLTKKWTLEEEFNNHMLRFHQVTVSSIFISVKHKITFQGWISDR